MANYDGVSQLLGQDAELLKRIAARMSIGAPTENRTGCSATISLNKPVEVYKSGGIAGKEEYRTVSGLPNDGVRYAMRELCHEAQAMVSGISDGVIVSHIDLSGSDEKNEGIQRTWVDSSRVASLVRSITRCWLKHTH